MIKLLSGDCRDVLLTLPAESVQCVVTSPPYYGLRDYGTALWDGGDAACDHTGKQPKRGNAEYTNGQGGSFSSNLQAWGDRDVSTVYRDTCGKCGAVRVDRQIGLEATPDEYLATMVQVFREVRRVLRRDGTCWVNMGDSYSSGSGGDRKLGVADESRAMARVQLGAKPKDLLLMPARLALALQADGWLLRSAICWHKPNPMPESCADRPTSSYEMVYLFAKCHWIGDDPGMFNDISDEDARWLALFLDTEGSIVCKRSEAPSGTIWYGAQISLANSSKALVGRAAAIIGKGTVIARPPQPGRFNMFYLQLSNIQASDLLKRVYSHLIVKQRQAALAIYLQSVLADADKHRRTKEGRLSRGRRRSEEYSAQLDRIWRTMKALNKRREVETDWVPEVKQGRWVGNRYFYDADAVREPHDGPHAMHIQAQNVAERERDATGQRRLGKQGLHDFINPAGRSCRNVWSIATHAYSAAHFATFPPELAERCIKAGTSEKGCCAACGKPWVRVTERVASSEGQATWSGQAASKNGASRKGTFIDMQATTTGWSAGCQCHGHFEERPAAPDWISEETGERKMVRVWVPDGDAPKPVPCTVLDPFAGAGTTLLVADRLQRHAVGIDLNVDYTRMAMDRCIADAPLFTSFAPAEDPEDERMADLFAGDEYERPKSLTTPRRDGARWNNHERGYGGFAPRTLPDMAAD